MTVTVLGHDSRIGYAMKAKVTTLFLAEEPHNWPSYLFILSISSEAYYTLRQCVIRLSVCSYHHNHKLNCLIADGAWTKTYKTDKTQRWPSVWLVVPHVPSKWLQRTFTLSVSTPWRVCRWRLDAVMRSKDEQTSSIENKFKFCRKSSHCINNGYK